MKQFIKCPECGEVQLLDIASLRYSLRQQYCLKCKKYFNSDLNLEPLKALSVKQPWAWLIVNGYKDLENRKTLKHLKGTFLIHAGQAYDTEGRIFVGAEKAKAIGMPYGSKIERGGIVGYVEFNGSVQESDSPWFAGPGFNGLVITEAHTLPFTPCKGQQGVFYPEIE
nr:hypothetical protein [uncultured Draconibacterium sp.]